MPRILALLTASCVLVAASLAAPGADAQPRAKKPPRGKAKGPDVAAAIASGDATRICQTAIDLGKAGDHVRAGLLVGACDGLEGKADDARKTRIAVSKAATAGDWSKVELVIKTAGATATIDLYPEIPLVAGAYRLPPGSYNVVARTAGGATMSELTLRDGNRQLVVLTPPAAPPPVRHKTVDFTSGEPMDAPLAGPPVIKNESLIPDRFRKGLGPPRLKK